MPITITNIDELRRVPIGALMVDRDFIPMTRTGQGDFAFWDKDDLSWTTIDAGEIAGLYDEEGSKFFPIVVRNMNKLPEPEPVSRFATDERTLTDAMLDRLVERVKIEILNDMGTAKNHKGEIMPITVGILKYAQQRGHDTGGYSELHDFVDANCYGGACEDGSTLTVGDLNAMSDVLNEWLLSGAARVECVARSLYNDFRDMEIPWEHIGDDDEDGVGTGRDYYRDAASNVLAWMES